MTALCGGGSSGPKPGYSELVYVSSHAVEAFLTLTGFGEVAIVLAPLIAGSTWELATFCATDPPADPGLTTDDVADALTFSNPALQLPALAKVKQWFESQYWYSLCQCSSTTTPAPPSPSMPGPISVNPGLPGGTAGPCLVTSAAPSWTPGAGNTFQDLSNLLPATGSSLSLTTTSGGFTHSIPTYAIPPGTSGAFYHGQYVGTDYGALPNGPTMRISWFDITGAEITAASIGSYTNRNAGPPVTWDPVDSQLLGVWPSGTARWGVEIVNSAAGAVGHQFDFDLNIGCVCTGDVLRTACCPPDPTLDAKLNQILGLLNAIYPSVELVTRVQRQLVPFASIAGATHSGLSGTGSFSVPRLLGLSWSVTTLPAHYGVSSGNPDYHFDLGFISVSTPDGFIDERRVTATSQAWYPPIMSDVTTVGYYLNPGVVIAVTEVETEPV